MFAQLARERIVGPFYFHKRGDWAGEYEYRLLLFDEKGEGNHAYLGIRGSLHAIIVGHRFPNAYRSCIWEAHKNLGVNVYQMIYGQMIRLVRYGPPPGQGE